MQLTPMDNFRGREVWYPFEAATDSFVIHLSRQLKQPVRLAGLVCEG